MTCRHHVKTAKSTGSFHSRPCYCTVPFQTSYDAMIQCIAHVAPTEEPQAIADFLCFMIWSDGVYDLERWRFPLPKRTPRFSKGVRTRLRAHLRLLVNESIFRSPRHCTSRSFRCGRSLGLHTGILILLKYLNEMTIATRSHFSDTLGTACLDPFERTKPWIPNGDTGIVELIERDDHKGQAALKQHASKTAADLPSSR